LNLLEIYLRIGSPWLAGKKGVKNDEEAVRLLVP